MAFACYSTTLDFFGEGGTYFIFWWRFFLSSLDSLGYEEQEDSELEDSSEDDASLWALKRY